MTMLSISKPIIVEGKYDKIKLSSIVKANIITTDGFGIFSAAEKAHLLRRLAEERGIIVLTDSDGAGLVIRNYLKNLLPPDKLIHLYIPQIKGRERRKSAPSKEGYLGVEGIPADMLQKLLTPYADDGGTENPMNLTKSDFYELGLSGRHDSACFRTELARVLSLPDHLSSNAMLAAINMLISENEFTAALETAKNHMQAEEE